MSELRVDSVKSKGGGAPNLPKGVTISGIATAATLGATQIDVSNVNVSGVVTSATLSGSLLSTGTPTLGLGVTINSSGVAISGVATAGIVSATTLYGDGSNLTGVGATLAPLFYQPDPYDTGVLFPAGIGITFNQQIKAGTGNVTLRLVGAAGTVVENFGVGSSVTISENRVIIDPTADLSVDTIYHISYPSGCFTNNEGSDYVGTAYTFQTRAYDYQLWSWAQNDYGQLGLNNRTQYSSPVQVPGTTWRNCFGSGDIGKSTGGTKTDGTLWMWGTNQYGGLGQNNRTIYSSPVQIPGTTWSDNFQVATLNCGSSGVKTDGTLWVWGQNNMGQLGLNNRTLYSSPVQLPGTTWSTAADRLEGTSESRMLAIKTDGTLWAWGRNQNGTLGLNQNGANTNLSSPTQVPGTTWANLTTSAQLTMATKTDGTLWVWGHGGPGILGQNNRTSRSSPTQIPGTTWSTGENKIAGGAIYAAAIKTDGTLWTWGGRYIGVLAQNGAQGGTAYGSGGGVSSPVQVPGTTWDQIVAQGYVGLATKTDGTIWAWGYGDAGGIGNDSSAHRSSPTQIGTDTDWNKISSSQYSNHAIKKV